MCLCFVPNVAMCVKWFLAIFIKYLLSFRFVGNSIHLTQIYTFKNMWCSLAHVQIHVFPRLFSFANFNFDHGHSSVLYFIRCSQRFLLEKSFQNTFHFYRFQWKTLATANREIYLSRQKIFAKFIWMLNELNGRKKMLSIMIGSELNFVRRLQSLYVGCNFTIF